jgi:EAL domain-containing protein (putative c-di-GMP-specific phosphodiesterase class I)
VALEHYGCSSQAQIIRHLPVDIVKIDGSLINNLASSKEHQEKVRSIIALARTLEKQCIAEQVDDPGSLAILWQFGVDLIQGNFVQEPNRELEYNFEGEIA